MINPNTLKDDDLQPEQNAEGIRMPIAETPTLAMLLSKYKTLHEKLLHDAPIRESDMREITEQMNAVKFVMGNTSFTLEEINTNPRLRRTMEVWRNFDKGAYDGFQYTGDIHDLRDLLYLNDSIAGKLGTSFVGSFCDLKNVLYVTDSQFLFLRECDAGLSLSGLQALTESQLAALPEFKTRHLELNGITTMTDELASAITQWQGNVLCLSGITELSDSQMATLALFDGKSLLLDGLESLSDAQADALAQYKGKFLYLRNINTLGKNALQSLRTIQQRMGTGLYLNQNMKIKISSSI